MRLTTGFKFDLPFELWTNQLDPLNGTVSYAKHSDELGMVVQGGGGLNLVTEEALPLYAQIRQLVDSKGTAIFMQSGVPYNMYVLTSEPQFDPFVRIIGWKHRLGRELPRDVVSELIAAGIGA